MTQQTLRSRAPKNQEIGTSRRRWNSETHIRHRDYSPTLGRFIERDPIGFEAGDNNLYRFVANGPTGKTDASGLENWIPGPTVGGVTYPWIPPGTYWPGHPLSNTPGTASPFHGLADALADLLGNSPTPDQLNEAARIAKRIQSTFENNTYRGIPPCLLDFRKDCANSLSKSSKGAYRGIDTVRGFYCWDWAYGFERNVLAESPRVFKVEVEWAAKPPTPNGVLPVHYWLAIHGPKGTVYVDDGFGAHEDFVHNRRPLPDGYTYQPPGSPGMEPRRECQEIPVR